MLSSIFSVYTFNLTHAEVFMKAFIFTPDGAGFLSSLGAHCHLGLLLSHVPMTTFALLFHMLFTIMRLEALQG